MMNYVRLTDRLVYSTPDFAIVNSESTQVVVISSIFSMYKFQAIALAILVATISLSGTGASASATTSISYKKVYFSSDSMKLTKAAKTELRQPW